MLCDPKQLPARSSSPCTNGEEAASPLPDPRIKMGIVGLNFGHHVLKEIVHGPGHPYLQVAAICDLDRERVANLAHEYGVKPFFDLDTLLADSDIEAIGLFTGPTGRAQLISRIVQAGKDVLTTKPFELHISAAAAVLQEAQRLGRIIHLNSPAPTSSPDLEQIEAWRRQFDLGAPVGARGEAWAHYQEKADGGWYDDDLRCPLAPVFRIGIYLINDLVQIFGPASEVQAIHSRLFTARPTPDNAQLAIRFQNGALANIYNSFCIDDSQPHRNSLILNFERGTIYRNVGPLPRFSVTDNRCRLKMITRGHNGRPLIKRVRLTETSGGYQWKAFHDAVRHSNLPPVKPITDQILEGLKIISAMSRAEHSGRIEVV